MTPIIKTGPLSGHFNIVFLADGFTAAQESIFIQQARKFAGGIVAADPFGEYAGKLNFFAKFVPSKEAGISKPLLGISKDTYFKCFYGWGGIQRAIGTPYTGLINPLLGEVLQHKHAVIILCNESERGGGGGSYIFASKGMSVEDVIHELGHHFDLADEYDVGYFALAVNLSIGIDVPWRSMLTPGVPMPTKVSTVNNNKIGAFQVAPNVYRPYTKCKMRTASDPFCPVCRWHIIKKLNDL